MASDQTQNITTHLITRSTPHGSPWIGNVLDYASGATPLTHFTPTTDYYLQITRIQIETADAFSVPANGVIRIFWGTSGNTWERIEFNDVSDLKTQATTVQASGVYAFEFYPHKGLNPIYILSSESDNLSVGCYSSGGTLQETAAITEPLKISVIGVQENEDYIA